MVKLEKNGERNYRAERLETVKGNYRHDCVER